MDSVNLDWVTNFVLDIADDVLRDLVRGENRDVILPIMVLRRLDAVLEATKIQRPFVWEPVKVRNLLDFLYQGYPVGYLIAWRNPTVRLKDGTSSAGKRILIDGQHGTNGKRC